MAVNLITTLTEADTSGCNSSGCGSSNEQLDHLPQHIRSRVYDHPCFSEEAHHHYARMHVAVAPACNIQCHYCNRKYDCSNESRPGVVSEVLTPDQAVKKVLAVAANIPQMTVLGIAGPGDPLANPEHTFETFRQLTEKAPDIKLCVSTNGLTLPEQVDELCRHNIDHVTITINCVDPEVGEKIYPWIFWNNRRIKGRKAAKILIKQQQKGLQMLTDRGILVKVNSVLIPGVNDQHLEEVSRIVKEKGAFLHNVMPLLAEAKHGTFYGVMGQRGPEHSELQALQDKCSGDMNMMRHCRQCRADAVGMLGEDRGDEFTMEKIADMTVDNEAAMRKRAEYRAAIEATRQAQKNQTNEIFIPLSGLKKHTRQEPRPVLMAVASNGGEIINQHFGHAQEFLVYEATQQDVRFIGHRKIDLYCSGNDTCGDTADRLGIIIDALTGCEVVLCSRIGYEPWETLEKAGIQPNGEHAMEQIEDAVAAVYDEMLQAGLIAKPQPLSAIQITA